MNRGAEIAAARPRVISALVAQLRDLDLAEEACDAAVERLLRQQVEIRDVGAWLYVAARRSAIDRLRRRQREQRAIGDAHSVGISGGNEPMADILDMPSPIPDERLRLIFICCHPALAVEARAALALRIICGLAVADIARLFLMREAAMYQRITRAKTKVREAGIPFELPDRRHWRERLDAVLLTLELAYTAAYQDAGGERDERLAGEVDFLATMLAELLPDEPEVLGLAALVALGHSRRTARLDEDGAMIPLSQQDPALWDRGAIARATGWLDRASAARRSGVYQVMAAIQLTHARRVHGVPTDWHAILALYDGLLALRPDPVVAINRAMALAQVEGADSAIAALDALPGERLAEFAPFHVARADLLARCEQPQAARAALQRALALEPATAERKFLQARLAQLG